jgi:hypothetical protein
MESSVDTIGALEELRENDLDTVSAGHHQHLGELEFGLLGGLLHGLLGSLHLGGLFGMNVTQTNTAVEIAVVIGGGSVVQVINQSNVVVA